MKLEDTILKYPRTPHLQGSRLQPGDEDLSQVPFSDIKGKHVVLEEKLDGANSGVSFAPDGELRLQSRGHFLTGGQREKHFNMLKQWGAVKSQVLHSVLGSRYVMYGEWLYAKHTVYYDALPHWFMEFDILDRETGKFLDTPTRHKMLEGTGVCHVPVLYSGVVNNLEDITTLLGPSNYITNEHDRHLFEDASKLGLNTDTVLGETDPTKFMEGIYIKIEENGETVGRLKYVRASFLQNVIESKSHWLDRPIVPNRINGGLAKFFE